MTEKNYNPNQQKNKSMKKAAVADKMKKTIIKDIEKKVGEKKEVQNKSEPNTNVKISDKSEPTKEKKLVNTLKNTKKKEIIKKDQAVVNSRSISISTKKAADICRFIKGKTIDSAMADLEMINKKKKVLPMKGEIPHQKGKRMMSGGFPKNASREFIVLLKSLIGNSNANGIDDPVITEAIANLASRPFGRFGRWKRKRTHIKLVARNKKEKKK